MKKEDTTTVLGLDVGTSRIVLARRADAGYQFESQLNAFVSVPFSRMTENALRQENVPYTTRGSEIVISGHESQRFADLLSVETRRPMHQGVLNPNEAEGPAVIRNLVESLSGTAKPGTRLCFSVPAAPLGGEDNLTYHEASLRQMLSEAGYQARSINEGLAVVYSELEDTNYSGIGISCGGGLCNVALAYLSMPVLSFSIAKAGDFIDASAASVTGELATRIRIAKESSFHFNGYFPDKLNQALSVYYDDVIQSLVGGMKEAVTATRRMPRFSKPVPIALSGGTALPQGFLPRFEKTLAAAEFPIAISEVRLAKDPLNTTAKGALVAALAEAD